MTSKTQYKSEDEEILLSPVEETVKIKGKLFYNEGARAWNIIRLKKELLQKYPYLKEKNGNFVYIMKLPRTFKELKEEIEKLEKESKTIPMIFLLGKGQEEN